MDHQTKEFLDFILESIDQINYIFTPIETIDDFLENREGLMRLDAISMRLQAIGETIKNISKQNEALLLKTAPKEYWSDIIRLRDLISHHYINIDAEIVFDICQNELDELKAYIEAISKDKQQRLLKAIEKTKEADKKLIDIFDDTIDDGL